MGCRTKRAFAIAAAVAGVIGSSQGASADVWTNPTTGGNWSVGSNWADASAPVSNVDTTITFFGNDTATIANAAIQTFTSTQNIAAPYQLGILQLGGKADGTKNLKITIAGNQLQFANNAEVKLDAIKGLKSTTYIVNNALDLAGTAKFTGGTVGQSKEIFTFLGAVTGSNGFTKEGTSKMALAGDLNGLSGTVTIKDGTVDLGSNDFLIVPANAQNLIFDVQGGTNIDPVTLLPIPARLNGLTAANGVITIKGLTGSGGVQFGNVNGETNVLEINNTANFTFAGAMDNKTTNDTDVTKSKFMALIKSGAGSQTLSGANLYTGTTTINGGTLFVNGTHSNAALMAANLVKGYAVNNTGTLGGKGTITLGAGFQIDVNSGGTLAPGEAGGATDNLTITASSVNFNATSAFAIDLGGASDSDKLSLTGALNLAAATDILTLTDLGLAYDGSAYTIAGFTGALTGVFDTLIVDGTTEASNTAFTRSGWNYSVNYNANDITLTAVAIPEPATFGLMGVSALLLATRRRRRVQAA